MKMANRIKCASLALVMLLVTTLTVMCHPVRVYATSGTAEVVTEADQIGDCNGNLVIVSESTMVPLELSSSTLNVSGSLFSNLSVDAAGGRKIVTPQGYDLYSYNIFEEVFDRAGEFNYHEGALQTSGNMISVNDYAEGNLGLSGQEICSGSLLGASENVQISAGRIKNQKPNQLTYIMAMNGDIRINIDQMDLYGMIYAPNGRVEINANRIDFRGLIIANEVVIRANRVSLKAQSIGIPVEMYSVGPEDAFIGDIMQAGSSSSGSGKYYYNTGGNGRDCAKYDRYGLLKTVKVGDIIYEANGGFGITGHIAVVHKIIVHPICIYSGSSYAGSYTVRQIQLIEAIDAGVCYGILDDVRCDDKDVSILRSSELTSSKWPTVRNFLERQIGKPFSFVGIGIRPEILPREKSIYTLTWYCSELAWAAYMSVGINIETGALFSEPGVTPHDIKSNSKLKRVWYVKSPFGHI